MRCPNNEQLERLAAAPGDTANTGLLAHTRECEACRRKLERVRTDASLVADIRELREHRAKIKPIQDEMTDTDGRIGAPPHHPV